MKINVFCQTPYCQNFKEHEYIPGEFIENWTCDDCREKFADKGLLDSQRLI